jgi:hypothetical protein
MRALIVPVAISLALPLICADVLRAQRSAGVSLSAKSQRDSSRSSPAGTFSSQLSQIGNQSRNSGSQSALDSLTGGPSASGPTQGSRKEQGFIGRDAEDVRNTFRNLNPRQNRRAMFDLMVENLNEMRESRRRRESKQAVPLPVRLPYRAAFDYPGLAPEVVAVRLRARFQIDLPDGISGPMPEIELVGRKATIRGVAGSEYQRRLIGQLVALEPGVSQVENLLEIAPR